MACVRCDKLECEPEGKKFTYLKADAKKPLGYDRKNPSNNAIICANKGCLEPGLVWLNEYEAAEYNKGERIFSTKTATKAGKDAEYGAKVRVQ
jgi:hypothetical protein